MEANGSPRVNPFRVLFVAAEAEPLIKVGGLGDVAGSLPFALRSLDPALTAGMPLDVRLVLPSNDVILRNASQVTPLGTFDVPHPDGPITAEVSLTEIKGIPTYLISGEPIPPSAALYSNDINDDANKFVFFSQAILPLARFLDFQPDILHINDWHTALAAYDLYIQRESIPFFAHTRSVFTVHNLPYMGAGTEPSLEYFGIHPLENPLLPPWARSVPLPIALATADQVVAVSPTYAEEIMTPEFGCSLQDFLLTRKDTVSGILNGLDLDAWDPSTDTALPVNFTADALPRRKGNKQALIEEFNLDPDPSIPLLISIGRMDRQKGLDIALEAMRSIADLPWQMIFLGTGDPIVENACRELERDFPDKVRAVVRFDGRLARRMYGGGDMILMPSRYEPCGLAQMISMRYGCVPIARATGGLRDTVKDSESVQQNTGFLFAAETPSACAQAVARAIRAFGEAPLWEVYQRNGMEQSFSWWQSALRYAQLYLELTGIPTTAPDTFIKE